MSNVAHLVFNKDTNKWEARFNNVMLCQSQSKGRVRDLIENGTCAKAISVGVTEVSELPSLTIGKQVSTAMNRVKQMVETPTITKSQYAINDRFEFLANFTDMVIEGTIPSLLVTGGAGLGKTTTVTQAFERRGLVNAMSLMATNPNTDLNTLGDYMVIKGYSTAKGLFLTLKANKNRICIFDDCDKVLKDPVGVNILKSALDSSGNRYVSWNAQSREGDDSCAPFEFEGGIIFISNLPQEEIDDAIKSRCMRVDLEMTTREKIERIAHCVDSMLHDIPLTKRMDALEFLKNNAERCTNLNFRTFIAVAKIRNSDSPKWEQMAGYTISA